MNRLKCTLHTEPSRAITDKRWLIKSIRLFSTPKPFGCGQDHGHLEPMLDGAKKNLQAIGHTQDYFKGKTLTADIELFIEDM